MFDKKSLAEAKEANDHSWKLPTLYPQEVYSFKLYKCIRVHHSY